LGARAQKRPNAGASASRFKDPELRPEVPTVKVLSEKADGRADEWKHGFRLSMASKRNKKNKNKGKMPSSRPTPEQPEEAAPPAEPEITDAWSKRVDASIVGALLVISAIPLFGNLSSSILWQDEAQTALISQTILDRGMPYGHDGVNHLSQELGAEYGDEYIWKWHTWLPFYFVAASFKLFGAGTFSARLPFVIFGIATIVLAYFFARRLWKDRHNAVMAAALLTFSVPFLLLSRQCRYYSMAAFFALLGLYAYVGMTENKRRSVLLFVVASFLLFHTHYIYCVGLLGTAGLHVLLMKRKHWKKVILSCAGITLICLPWILWLSTSKYSQQYGGSLLSFSNAWKQTTTYGSDILKYVFPVALLAIPLVVLVVRKVQKEPLLTRDPEFWKALTIPVLFVVLTVGSLSLTAPAPFFRYLAPVLPIVLILGGLLLGMLCRIHVAVGAMVLLACLVLQPLGDFFHELTNDYTGPLEAAVDYLNEHAEKDDVVAITYGDMPVKFYTGLRVVGGLTGEDLGPALSARWVIRRQKVVSRKDWNVLNFLHQNLNMRSFTAIPLNVPDVRFENRESPNEHRYRTPTEGASIVIHKRNP
jgi:hypothetical protein